MLSLPHAVASVDDSGDPSFIPSSHSHISRTPHLPLSIERPALIITSHTGPRQPIGSRAWVGTEYVCFGQRLGRNLDVDPNPSLIGQSRPAPPLGGSQGISHSSCRWETRGASCKNFWSSDSGSRVDVLDTPVALCR